MIPLRHSWDKTAIFYLIYYLSKGFEQEISESVLKNK